ncbi:MAG TPA: chlorite dismutase family protein [Anaerolineaceae bacterium]|nr:chlorite dismutase family protein [Anaerolineaceae bacterium]
MTLRIFSHFHFLHFSENYWNSPLSEKQEIHKKLLGGLNENLAKFEIYQAFPLRSEVDILLWSTMEMDDEKCIAKYFKTLAITLNPFRKFIESKQSWWGMTRPSDYARGKSAQEIDPFEDQRSTYLVVYPFSKTANWYKMSRDARQGMMNEHIRIGHQFPEIKQLLLYSTGLQDQEFIVTYETEDLAEFSKLVMDLRSSEARLFTERDTPIFTAIYHSPEETLNLFI